jgi:hypothetical protein
MRKLVRRLRACISKLRSAFLIFALGTTPAIAAPMSDGAILTALNTCLHVSYNRALDAAGAWDKERYKVEKTEMSDADRMNGIEASGTIEIALPVKQATTDWSMGAYVFPFKIQNGGLVLQGYNPDGLAFPITSPEWSCEFKGGQRVVSPTESAITFAMKSDPSLTMDVLNMARDTEYRILRSQYLTSSSGWPGATMTNNATGPFHHAADAGSAILGVLNSGVDVHVVQSQGARVAT